MKTDSMKRLRPNKETKKTHHMQFYPSVHKIGTDSAKDLGISFQEHVARLITEHAKKG